MKNINLAIVGATGLVGRTFLKVLEEKKLPIDNYTLFASKNSKNKTITFMGKKHTIHELNQKSFNSHFDYALFSAGKDVALQYAPIAVKNNCIVIDNSSAFRMNENVPLVVPEVNANDIFDHQGIISNPNCSTIQAVVALKPLLDRYGISRIVFSTYQAVSGAGKLGCTDLENGINGILPQKFPHPIFNNCLPHIDDFTDNGYTKEEMKMINETKKILHDNTISITATAVRVPVFNSHSESINVELKKQFDLEELKQLLSNSNGIILQDNICNNIYPQAIEATGHNDVFVGRIRRDFSLHSGINMWVVADNIRKGAATNAIQILEALIASKEHKT